MRIGPSHRDVAILLIGAMSRYVNHLEDEDMDKPRTKTLLKALSMFAEICAHLIAKACVLIYLRSLQGPTLNWQSITRLLFQTSPI